MVEAFRCVEGIADSARWVVSAFAIVSWRVGRIEITSAVSGETFATSDPHLLRLVHAFARPATIKEVVRGFGEYAQEEILACVAELIGAGVLAAADAPEPEAARHHWDATSLAFHRSSRRPGFEKSQTQMTPTVAPRRSQNAIPLIPGALDTGRGFVPVLGARRSWRAWTKEPISHRTFSSFLWLSARNRGVCREGVAEEWLSRPYPSGGAAYSLELYPVLAAGAVDSIAPGLYRYLPNAHQLEPVSSDDAEYRPFLEAAGRSAGVADPPVVLVVTSRFSRQSETYRELAYSLVLKEVGCLFQTLYLVGEYLGLGSCALGGGTPDALLARICGTSGLAEPVVGEFMLGPR